jgi:hypothetical protein
VQQPRFTPSGFSVLSFVSHAPSARVSCACLVFLAGLAACQSLPPVDADPAARVDRARAAFAAAAEADQAGDAETALTAMRQALALRPNHPTLIYNAAALEAQGGYTASARLLLGKLARMGVGLDVRKQPAFASMHGREDFERIADQLAFNSEPVGETPLAHAFEPPVWTQYRLPEGVAYDVSTKTWYLSTVASGELLNSGGESIATRSRNRGFFGIAFDSARRVLWATAATPPGKETNPEVEEGPGLQEVPPGRSLLYRIEVDKLETWQVISQGPIFMQGGESVIAVPGEQPAALGDVTVLKNGTVLASDGEGGMIWRVISPDEPRAGDGPWMEAWLQGPPLPSPQGLAEAVGGIYLADYSSGLHRLDAHGERQSFVIPEDLCDLGIDGLAAADPHHLVAIQNGFAPQRILYLTLSENGTAITNWQVLAAGLPEWREPTLGFVREGWFYFVANSHWPDYADFENPQPGQGPPEIRRIKLPVGPQ